MELLVGGLLYINICKGGTILVLPEERMVQIRLCQYPYTSSELRTVCGSDIYGLFHKGMTGYANGQVAEKLREAQNGTIESWIIGVSQNFTVNGLITNNAKFVHIEWKM